MKNLFVTVLISVSFTFCLASCSKNDEPTPNQSSENPSNPIGNPSNPTSNPTSNPISNPIGNKLKITIGSVTFTATLNDNSTATFFKSMLPLTINMRELNGNEKFHYFASTLPTNATTGNIRTGDLVLYGNNCLVLFYENLNTSYSYTRLGKIENISGFVSALGTGSVTVKYELE